MLSKRPSNPFGVKVTVDDVTMAIITYYGEVYAQWLWTRVAPGRAINLRTIYGSKGSVGNDGLFIQREDSVETQSMNTLVSRMFESLQPEEKAR
ncbi:MAG: hypothetical protein QXS21_06690 [Thermoproteota archaeon]|uniref:hypothetical protein n=1 Tax=Thermoprotei TaxID=183924 RepID=UPI003164AA06